jgi:hypothetical protein
MPRLFSFLFAAVLLSAVGCATQKTAAKPSYAGDWAVSIAGTPLGDVQGTLSLMPAEDGSLSGKFASNGAEYDLRSVTVNEASLRAVFYYSDYGVDVEIKLDGAPAGPLSGVTNNEYMTTAQRK